MKIACFICKKYNCGNVVAQTLEYIKDKGLWKGSDMKPLTA